MPKGEAGSKGEKKKELHKNMVVHHGGIKKHRVNTCEYKGERKTYTCKSIKQSIELKKKISEVKCSCKILLKIQHILH